MWLTSQLAKTSSLICRVTRQINCSKSSWSSKTTCWRCTWCTRSSLPRPPKYSSWRVSISNILRERISSREASWTLNQRSRRLQTELTHRWSWTSKLIFLQVKRKTVTQSCPRASTTTNCSKSVSLISTRTIFQPRRPKTKTSHTIAKKKGTLRRRAKVWKRSNQTQLKLQGAPPTRWIAILAIRLSSTSHSQRVTISRWPNQSNSPQAQSKPDPTRIRRNDLHKRGKRYSLASTPHICP